MSCGEHYLHLVSLGLIGPMSKEVVRTACLKIVEVYTQ